MEDERVISFERGKQLADQLGVEFFETSAKENVNVKVKIGSKFNIYSKFFAFLLNNIITRLFLPLRGPRDLARSDKNYLFDQNYEISHTLDKIYF